MHVRFNIVRTGLKAQTWVLILRYEVSPESRMVIKGLHRGLCVTSNLSFGAFSSAQSTIAWAPLCHKGCKICPIRVTHRDKYLPSEIKDTTVRQRYVCHIHYIKPHAILNNESIFCHLLV